MIASLHKRLQVTVSDHEWLQVTTSDYGRLQVTDTDYESDYNCLRGATSD